MHLKNRLKIATKTRNVRWGATVYPWGHQEKYSTDFRIYYVIFRYILFQKIVLKIVKSSFLSCVLDHLD